MDPRRDRGRREAALRDTTVCAQHGPADRSGRKRADHGEPQVVADDRIFTAAVDGRSKMSLEVVERPTLIEEVEPCRLRSGRIQQRGVVPGVLLEPVPIDVRVFDQDRLRANLGMPEIRSEVAYLIARQRRRSGGGAARVADAVHEPLEWLTPKRQAMPHDRYRARVCRASFEIVHMRWMRCRYARAASSPSRTSSCARSSVRLGAESSGRWDGSLDIGRPPEEDPSCEPDATGCNRMQPDATGCNRMQPDARTRMASSGIRLA